MTEVRLPAQQELKDALTRMIVAGYDSYAVNVILLSAFNLAHYARKDSGGLDRTMGALSDALCHIHQAYGPTQIIKPKPKSAQAQVEILTEQVMHLINQNRKIRDELEALKKQSQQTTWSRFSKLFMKETL